MTAGLIGRMSGHVDHAERVITDVQGHFTSESDHRHVRFVIFQQIRLVWSKGRDARNMCSQIGAEDSRSDALLRNYRNVKKRVAGPVVAVRLGVDDITEPSAPLDLAFQAHGVARLVRRIDQYNAVRSRYDAVVGALKLGLHEYISCELLHASPILTASCHPERQRRNLLCPCASKP